MVEFLIQFQLSLFAIFALLALLVSIYYKKEVYSHSNRLFRAIILNMILIMFLEIMSWALDGIETQVAYVLNYGFNFVLVALTLGIPAFWATYIDYKVNGSIKRTRNRLLYMHGFVIVLLLLIVNIFVPIIFSISPENVYSREPGLWFSVIYSYGLLVYVMLMVFKNRKSVQSNLLFVVVLFMVLPAIAVYFQMTNYGLVIMWPTLSIAVIVAYLFLETESSTKDYLTGLYNRSMLNDYASRLIDKNHSFSVVMIDLDDYKKINDKYGHYTGDKMIVMFAKLLKSTFPDKSLVSRYGGDEFIVVIEGVDEQKLNEYKISIKDNIKVSDDSQFKAVRFSYGTSSRTSLNRKNFNKLLAEADDLMYQDKAINKNYGRRKSDR